MLHAQQKGTMTEALGPGTAILYQNPAKTVTLIDVPTSISLAQGTLESPNRRKLFSSSPLQSPYVSTEPKSEAAKAKVQKTMGVADQEFPTELLLNALREVGDNLCGEWCLPRQTLSAVSKSVDSKRKSSHLAGFDAETQAQEPNLRLPKTYHDRRQESDPQSPLELSQSPPFSTAIVLHVQSISHQLVRNSNTVQLPLHISMISQTYIVPPCSSFMLSTIDELSFRSFSHAAYEIYPNPSFSAGPGQFDFVLLDPPWDNRSVRRAQRYTTLRQKTNPMDVLRDMLGKHIAPRALVGCWITNKSLVRDTVLEALTDWGVQLIEEWAWLKTTGHGEPMSRVDGLWRKPYEILLLGRKQDLGSCRRGETAEVGTGLQRRVIVAVPDLHSRKPNLKELITPMMANPIDYRTLEVFARNLTAGWWAWGDEVLKFSWEGHWSKGD